MVNKESIEKIFREEIVEKKRAASGIKHKTGKHGYVGVMRMPSDFHKEEKKPSTTVSYNINDILNMVQSSTVLKQALLEKFDRSFEYTHQSYKQAVELVIDEVLDVVTVALNVMTDEIMSLWNKIEEMEQVTWDMLQDLDRDVQGLKKRPALPVIVDENKEKESNVTRFRDIPSGVVEEPETEQEPEVTEEPVQEEEEPAQEDTDILDKIMIDPQRVANKVMYSRAEGITDLERKVWLFWLVKQQEDLGRFSGYNLNTSIKIHVPRLDYYIYNKEKRIFDGFAQFKDEYYKWREKKGEWANILTKGIDY